MFTAGDAPTPRTLLDIVRASAEQHPNALAVDDGTTALTYRALITEVLELKEKLAADGVGVGDRVGIRVPSGTVDLYVSILATLATGT